MNLIKTLAAAGAAALISASTLNVAGASALTSGLTGLNSVSTLQAAENRGPGQADRKGHADRKSVKGGNRQHQQQAGHNNVRKEAKNGGRARQHQEHNGSKVRKSSGDRGQHQGAQRKQPRQAGDR